MSHIEIPHVFQSDFLERYYLHSTAPNPPLRIGVLIDDVQLIGPFAAVLDQIQRCNFARLALTVHNSLALPVPAPEAKQPLPIRLARLLADPVRRRKLAFELYTRADEKMFPAEAHLLAPIDCSPLFEGVEQMTVAPMVKGFVHRFPEEAVATIRERRLDVILRFGFNILRGGLLEAAQYGIWSYHHGDNDFYRGGPSHFWELYEDNPCSGVILQVLTEELDNGLILDKAIARSNGGFSHAKNRVRPYLLGAHMVLRALHDLHEHGWEHVRKRAFVSASYQGRRKIYRMPSTGETARFALSRVRSSVTKRIHARGRDYHWRIGWRHIDGNSPLPVDTKSFQWFESPADRFFADPFLIRRNDRLWLFFEDYLYPERRGRISCAEMLPDGRLGDVVPVLDLPTHLSYPFVFEHAGEMFMVPESMSTGTVDLFRALDFPHRWVKEKTLLDSGGLDTIIHEHDGRFWMFTTVVDPPAADHSLLLFHAADLFGEWEFHPANPISTDIRYSRNGGALIASHEGLIRPAQDCSVRYGYALGFQSIRTLNTHEYAEATLHRLLPPEHEGILGVHTYARGGGFDVIDGTLLRRV